MKNIFQFAALATGSLLIATPVMAQTAGAFMTNPSFQGPRPARCVSTLEMQRCAAADLRSADARMSARYKALSASLRPAAKQALLSEQHAWLKSRDRNCRSRGTGGSIGSLNVAQCWVYTTEARAGALEIRMRKGGNATILPASAFVGRWRGGEGTYMKIRQEGSGFVVDNQWGGGEQEDMRGMFRADLIAEGLRFRRKGETVTVRPSIGDKINRSALRGLKDCLMVSIDEGYCRY